MAVDEILNTLNREIANGRSIDGIEKDIFIRLSPYFTNKVSLRKNLSNSSIVSAYEFIIKYSGDIMFSKGLREILDCYSLAFKKNQNEVTHIILDTYQDFVERENMMWSIRQRTVPVTEDLYDKVMFYFEYIGNTLEISVKGIIHEIYALIRLINGKNIDYNKICKTDFGVAINNILTHNCFEEILQVGPNNMKLSDWRNIANHNSYKITNEEITCTYGKIGTSFTLQVDEFLDCIYKIIRNGNILNIARCIFVYDNLDALSSSGAITKSEFRESMIFNQIKMTLIVQGFIIKYINKSNDALEVEIQDLNNDGYKDKKYVELRQSTFCEVFKMLWIKLKVKRINIKYFNKFDNLDDALWLEPIEK